jgi:hypothetical protein
VSLAYKLLSRESEKEVTLGGGIHVLIVLAVLVVVSG